MGNKYHWCSYELEPDYKDCTKCPFNCDINDCERQYIFHLDAVRDCDFKRSAKGLPLIVKNFDLMKENFRKKEFVEQERIIEQVKIETSQHSLSSKSENDLKNLLNVVVVIFLVSFPAAYLFPILTIFTEFLFDSVVLFFGGGTSLNGLDEPIKDSFFYSEYWSRYIYCVSLMSVAWVWIDGLQKDDIMRTIQIVVIIVFIFVALLNINLVIGTIFGPIFIIFGLFITAKRR